MGRRRRSWGGPLACFEHIHALLFLEGDEVRGLTEFG